MIFCHILAVGQSDSLRQQQHPADEDTVSKDFISNDSDEDATKLTRDRYKKPVIIDSEKDQRSVDDTLKSVASNEENGITNGVTLRNGKMMIRNNGKWSTLNKEIIMHNGVKVKSNGTIITPDGSKFVVNEGQFIDMSGNLLLSSDSIQSRKH